MMLRLHKLSVHVVKTVGCPVRHAPRRPRSPLHNVTSVTDSEGCPRHTAAMSPREGHASTGHSQHVKTAEAVY